MSGQLGLRTGPVAEAGPPVLPVSGHEQPLAVVLGPANQRAGTAATLSRTSWGQDWRQHQESRPRCLMWRLGSCRAQGATLTNKRQRARPGKWGRWLGVPSRHRGRTWGAGWGADAPSSRQGQGARILMLSGRCPVRGPVPPVRAGEAGEGRAALCLVASVPLVVAAGPCIRG